MLRCRQSVTFLVTGNTLPSWVRTLGNVVKVVLSEVSSGPRADGLTMLVSCATAVGMWATKGGDTRRDGVKGRARLVSGGSERSIAASAGGEACSVWSMPKIVWASAPSTATNADEVRFRPVIRSTR